MSPMPRRRSSWSTARMRRLPRPSPAAEEGKTGGSRDLRGYERRMEGKCGWDSGPLCAAAVRAFEVCVDDEVFDEGDEGAVRRRAGEADEAAAGGLGAAGDAG